MGMVSYRVSRGIVYNNYFIRFYSDMKKIILLIVFFVYLIHSGWAQDNNTKETGADELNKARKQLKNEETIVERHFIKVTDDEWPTQVIYDTTNICYQGTLRWIVMGNPNLANQLPPVHIVRAMVVHCFCVMDKLRTQYKFTPYTDMLKGDNPLMPKFLPELFMKKALQCIKEHNTLSGLVVIDPNMINQFLNDNETKNDTRIEVKPPDNNSGKSDSIPEQPNELPTEDAPLLNF